MTFPQHMCISHRNKGISYHSFHMRDALFKVQAKPPFLKPMYNNIICLIDKYPEQILPHRVVGCKWSYTKWVS